MVNLSVLNLSFFEFVTDIIKYPIERVHQGTNMFDSKEAVLLLGASGSMGFEAFTQLWERKDKSPLESIQPMPYLRTQLRV